MKFTNQNLDGDRPRSDAFTLIELLVVVAIIAILASLLLPALSKSKELATGAACINGQKQLAFAFMMYADDNNEKLPVDIVNGNWVLLGGGYWPAPTYSVPTTLTGKEREKFYILEAIKLGPLYKYSPNAQAYHCPGDQREKLPLGAGWAYDSYSKQGDLDTITKRSEIRNPSRKYVFLEEADPRGFNQGTWIMDGGADIADPASGGWIDVFAIWHNRKSTLGFADGHVEMHRWLEKTTMDACRPGNLNPFGWARNMPRDRDLEYAKPGYVVRGP